MRWTCVTHLTGSTRFSAVVVPRCHTSAHLTSQTNVLLLSHLLQTVSKYYELIPHLKPNLETVLGFFVRKQYHLLIGVLMVTLFDWNRIFLKIFWVVFTVPQQASLEVCTFFFLG